MTTPYVPTWHPEGLAPLPDFIQVPMLRSDIAKAQAEMFGSGNVCRSCPVAQVMIRHYPSYRWSVGSNDAGAAYLNITEHPEQAASFAMDTDTREFISRLPGEIGTEGFDVDSISVLAFVRMRKFTPDWTRANWYEEGLTF